MAITPMMQQYLEIKENYKDCILFFRLGDFYEMFFEDALVASKAMEITLTGKSCGLEERAPMCGVPYHACDVYIAKLVEKGFKVAICEQMEDASGKGIVRREVIKIITPGTVVSQAMLEERENNYLACVFLDENGSGMAYCDISTGEIAATEWPYEAGREGVANELVKKKPREILTNIAVEDSAFLTALQTELGSFFTVRPEQDYREEDAENRILRQFGVASGKGIGLDDKPMATRALGA